LQNFALDETNDITPVIDKLQQLYIDNTTDNFIDQSQAPSPAYSSRSYSSPESHLKRVSRLPHEKDHDEIDGREVTWDKNKNSNRHGNRERRDRDDRYSDLFYPRDKNRGRSRSSSRSRRRRDHHDKNRNKNRDTDEDNLDRQNKNDEYQDNNELKDRTNSGEITKIDDMSHDDAFSDKDRDRDKCRHGSRDRSRNKYRETERERYRGRDGKRYSKRNRGIHRESSKNDPLLDDDANKTNTTRSFSIDNANDGAPLKMYPSFPTLLRVDPSDLPSWVAVDNGRVQSRGTPKWQEFLNSRVTTPWTDRTKSADERAKALNGYQSFEKSYWDEIQLELISQDKQKLRGLLGYELDEDGERAPYLWREDYCGVCGTQHTKPELLDLYSYCKFCNNSLRDPKVLQERYKLIPVSTPLDILFATLGDAIDPDYVIECTEPVKLLVNEYNSKDRINFKSRDDVVATLGLVDPMPGRVKQLRIRYRMLDAFATAILELTVHNKVPVQIMLMVPKVRDLKIMRATWGHPRGRDSTGRMSIDVTERMQGMVDLAGGSYLSISPSVSIGGLLGDPCPGYTKDLLISYDIGGRTGFEQYQEVRGHLRRSVIIETSPMVKPLIFVESAFYGVTPTAKRDRLHFLNKKLSAISVLVHRKHAGAILTPEEIAKVEERCCVMN